MQMELWRMWFKKELKKRNEQSKVDNNGPDKMQRLTKCFESLRCFASVGTLKNQNTQSKTLFYTHTQTHTHPESMSCAL